MSATKKSPSRKVSSPRPTPKSMSTASARDIARALHATICILALSLVISTAKQVLTPLFGSAATNLLMQKVVLSSTVALALLPTCSSAPALGAVLALAPVAFHQIGSQAARRKDPFFGPVIAYMPVLAPVAWLTIGAVRNALPRIFTQSTFRQTGAVLSGIAVALAISKTYSIWPSKPLLDTITQPLLTVLSAWLVVGSGELVQRSTTKAGTRTVSQKYLHLLTLLPILATTFLTLCTSPTRPLSLPHTVYNSTDPSSPLLRILSSAQSITGRIVVAENYEHGFRYLRADHSLLGGVWIGDRVYSMDASKEARYTTDINGEKLGDSIYSAFVLQEAVRLTEREAKQEKALIIGLGAGISASAFSRHGLNTTVVEIDPAVYAAARDWFGFGLSEETKPTGGVYLEDARGWVQRKAMEQAREADESEKFDIVVHDCFSGGGVPEQLFTMEFWQMLKKVVKKDGIIAVNFAGQIDSNPSKAILATLERSFAQCRVFHDYYSDTPEEKLPAEFINIVFFCTPSDSPPLTFRPSTHSDYLNSYLREYVLRDIAKREVRLDLIRGNLTRGSVDELAFGYVLTDKNNLLGKWEHEAALEHWGVMRSVMGAIYWETY